MTFDEWLDEVENFSSRAERLLAEFEYAEDGHRFIKWLKAAYDVGYNAGKDKGPLAHLGNLED